MWAPSKLELFRPGCLPGSEYRNPYTSADEHVYAHVYLYPDHNANVHLHSYLYADVHLYAYSHPDIHLHADADPYIYVHPY